MMKKLSIVAMVALVFAACDKLDLDLDLIDQIFEANKVEIAVSDLPTAAQETLDEVYFETYTEKAMLARGLGYQVQLSNLTEVFFDEDGEMLNNPRRRGRRGNKPGCDRDSTLDISTLPTSILNYVATNYPTDSIRRAKLDRDGNFLVGITGHVILVFDANGNFIEVATFVHRHRGQRIDIATLPQSITDYVTTNYATAEIKVAFQKDDGYGVGILLDDNTKVMLIFDADGNFVKVRTCNGNG